MTVIDHADRLAPADDGYRAGRVTYWRDQARDNVALGMMDLAARCESFASAWEWGVETQEGAP